MKKMVLTVVMAFMVLGVSSGLISCGNSSPDSIRGFGNPGQVKLTGVWVAKDGDSTFKMIFEKDHSYVYGCGGGRSGGPSQLFVDGDGKVGVEKEFNSWWQKGFYTTNGNVLTMTCENYKDFTRRASFRKGSSNNYIVSIVSKDEIIIQTSGTGSIRTYKRETEEK